MLTEKPGEHHEGSTDRIERVLNELVEMDRRANGSAADQNDGRSTH
jgi:hypothetical protein